MNPQLWSFQFTWVDCLWYKSVFSLRGCYPIKSLEIDVVKITSCKLKLIFWRFKGVWHIHKISFKHELHIGSTDDFSDFARVQRSRSKFLRLPEQFSRLYVQTGSELVSPNSLWVEQEGGFWKFSQFVATDRWRTFIHRVIVSVKVSLDLWNL